MPDWLLLARHGTVEGRRSGVLGCAADAPLSALGWREARSLAEAARRYRPEALVASPMLRARQTAEAVSEALGLPVEMDDDLREIGLGEWEGKTFEEIAAQDPAAVERWAEFAPDFAPPGGEVAGDFFARVCRALGRLSARPERAVMAVAHGGVVRAALCRALGLAHRNYLLFDVQPGALAAVRWFGENGTLFEMRAP